MVHMDGSGRPPLADKLDWTPALHPGAVVTRPAERPAAGRRVPLGRLQARLLALLLLAALPVFGLEVWRGLSLQHDAVAAAERDALGLARALAAQHRLLVEEGRRGLALLSTAPAVVEGTPACAADLAATAARIGVLTGVSLVRPDLMSLCSAGSNPPGPAVAAAVAREALASGRFTTAEVTHADLRARPLLPVAQPVPGPDGQPRTVLAAALDLLWFSPRLVELLPGRSDMLVLADRGGRIIATVPEAPQLIGRPLPEGAAIAAAGSAEEKVLPDSMLDERPVILAFAGHEGGLTIAVAADRAQAMAAADTALVQGLGWLALVFAVGVIVAHMASHYMVVVPVRRLETATRSLMRGDFAQRLGPPYGGITELADLSHAFDQLTERLASREAALITSETQLSVKRQSEERYRTLVELAPEAIVVQARGAVLYANSKAVSLFGADRLEELLARPLVDLVHDEARDIVRERIVESRDDGAVTLLEVRLTRLDGRDFYAEVVIGPMGYGGRAATHLMIRDVTDSRDARERLRESEERYRALIESSPDMVLAHDRGRVLFANRRAAELFGESEPAAVIGRSLFDVVVPEQRRLAEGRVVSFYADPRPLERVEMRLALPDGRSMVAEVHSAPITFAGRLCIHTVVRDVTLRRAEQASVAQSAKLATLGELAAGMAHELAQPMNIIRMAAEAALLRLDTPGEAPPPAAEQGRSEVRKRFELIAGQAGRMGEIIDHMRIFTRRDDGPEETFDAAAAARAALALVDHAFTGDGIAVHLDLPPTGLAWVRGRPVQLEQVILNLLTNARDAVLERRSDGRLPQGWSPTVALGCHVEAGSVVISVEDTGKGVPAEILPRLFEPFYTTKAAGVGTGLGLSISDGLIRGMGGRIAVETRTLGDGARFVVTLPHLGVGAGPAAEPVRPPAPPRIVPPPAADADDDEEASALVPHVLVADDEREAALLMADYLRARGNRVTIAQDGEQATEAFMRDPADILVTDLRMPRCDGRNLIVRLRAHVPDLPVVVVTGHVGEQEARALEADDDVAAVLRKPVSLARVADLVDELFAASA
ncbi:PAS domain S-box-containing protein [Caenispirillum bisanense]|uniref:histidine kinase n=1 Tax=Caenispirillum bisanense TaxID=414052 RepID=A0A286H1M9_9PROT|nr:PAS domain S-box-containing protein [Caenispirillum bisanense]